MNNYESIWEEFTEEIARLKVLNNIIEHSAEVQINNLNRLGQSHDPEIKRYHHGINFVKHKYENNKPVVVNIETKSFNIKDRIKMLEEQHNEQYKFILSNAYESFRKFIKDIWGGEQEINLLIDHNYTDVYHDSFNINLFYVINIIRVMRNKISHNENINPNIIYNDIDTVLKKKNISLSDLDKKTIQTFSQKFINKKGKLVLNKILQENNLYYDRINNLINCLLSYSYYIKETKLK